MTASRFIAPLFALSLLAASTTASAGTSSNAPRSNGGGWKNASGAQLTGREGSVGFGRFVRFYYGKNVTATLREGTAGRVQTTTSKTVGVLFKPALDKSEANLTAKGGFGVSKWKTAWSGGSGSVGNVVSGKLSLFGKKH